MMLEAPRIFPTMRCRDADTMIAWLVGTVGFVEHAVYRHDGVVMHAQLAYGSSMIMLGQHRDDEYGAMVGDLDGRRTDAIYVAVDDPDALHTRLAAAGTTIATPPADTDYGSRDFSARDPEGNLWNFGSYWPKASDAPD
ncbi:VOC family protein [Sphingomonas japonica]|uniref:Glyoxalase superfamily protein PhnB n=1 Tax=Sphingomonas japonica TaxID=511662 RepID=A0ABX0U4H7_9SPHN|nr:VOC family protein [Sphingomonas japonica]NIJ24955.1 putative glyoxalase superfamily protein PhnB [Sphingomonas japonica]